MNINYLKYLSQKRIIFKLVAKQFSKETKKLSSSDKMNLILEKQRQMKKEHSEENKLFEAKMEPVFNYMNYVRSPIYLSILGLIWSNPFTITYFYLSIFSNYYLIFLTCIEGSAVFSLGLINYYLVRFNVPDNKELIELKFRNNRKRLMMLISFFMFLILSGYHAVNDNTNSSLITLFITNIYLYVKYSLQMGNHMGNSLYLMPRMKFVYTNMILTICMMIIINKKNKTIQLNVKY